MAIYYYIMVISILSKQCLSNHDWDYGANGPDVWSESYPSCSGQRQSPINIKTKCTTPQTFDSLSFTSSHSDEINFLIRNNGHTIIAEADDNQEISIQGGNLNGIFYFHGVHIHWGANHNTGSEHQINGDKSGGESHFVYENNVTNERAVLSFLMESRMSGNESELNLNNIKQAEEWKKYFDIAHNLTKDNDSMRINLTLKSLMGMNLQDFWRYEGSLTTPPCTENVVWTVFQEKILVLDYEFDSFRHDLFFESFRGPQPLYYRKIYRSFDDGTISPIPDQNLCVSKAWNGKSWIFKNNKTLFYLFIFGIIFFSF